MLHEGRLETIAPYSQHTFQATAGGTIGAMVQTSFETYLACGVWSNDSGAWTHLASGANNIMLALKPGTGIVLFASDNSTASWNVANGRLLISHSGAWSSAISPVCYSVYGITTNTFGNTSVVNAALSTGIVEDILQFRQSNLQEITTDGTNWTTETVSSELFAGQLRSGGRSLTNATHKGIRWTWTNSMPNMMFEQFHIYSSTNGNSFTLKVETSADGTNWTTVGTSGAMSSWPGNSFYTLAFNTTSKPYLRLTITPTWSHATNGIDLFKIRAFGAYNYDTFAAGNRLWKQYADKTLEFLGPWMKIGGLKVAQAGEWNQYTYTANYDCNTQTTINDPMFLQPTGRTNAPSWAAAGMGYLWMTAGGDVSSRGVQFWADSVNIGWRERNVGTWRKLWHDGNFAADYAIVGDNQSRTKASPATQDLTHLSMYSSGFWDVTGASWTPTTDWWWGITAAHRSNSSSYNFGMQIAGLSGGGRLCFRTIGSGTPTAWYDIPHSGNIGTQFAYLPFISSVSSTAGNGSTNTFTGDGGIGADAIVRSGFFRDNGGQFGRLGIAVVHPTNSAYCFQIGSTGYGENAASSRLQVRFKTNSNWGSTYTIAYCESPAFTGDVSAVGSSTSWGNTPTAGYRTIMGTGSSATWLCYGTSGGVFRGGVQLLDDAIGAMRLYAGGNYVQIGPGATLTYNGYPVFHIGNSGHSSGFDADKVDGLHATSLARADSINQDANTINRSGFYHCSSNVPVTSPGGTTESDKAVLHTEYSTGTPGWATQIAQSWREERVWVRRKTNGVWGYWAEIDFANYLNKAFLQFIFDSKTDDTFDLNVLDAYSGLYIRGTYDVTQNNPDLHDYTIAHFGCSNGADGDSAFQLGVSNGVLYHRMMYGNYSWSEWIRARNHDNKRDYSIYNTNNSEIAYDDETVIVDSSSNITLLFKDIAGQNGIHEGRTYKIKNIGTGTVTFDAYSTQTIDGALTKRYPPGQAGTLMVINGNFRTIEGFGLANSMDTIEGGRAVQFINKTGGNSVKGTVVRAYRATAINNAVDKIVIDIPDPIGVIYEDGVPDGSPVWVVQSGIADVYFVGDTTRGALARGFITGDSGYVSGQALSEAVPSAPFATDKHFYELGHVNESRTGAGLAKVSLHFN